jgi:hypothetical protein
MTVSPNGNSEGHACYARSEGHACHARKWGSSNGISRTRQAGPSECGIGMWNRRGMLVMPAETGSIIKHDITDATSASLRKADPTSESLPADAASVSLRRVNRAKPVELTRKQNAHTKPALVFDYITKIANNRIACRPLKPNQIAFLDNLITIEAIRGA